MKSICHTSSPSSSFILPPPTSNPPPHTYCTYFTVLVFLIFELTFRGVSQCMPSVGVLDFGLFNPLECPPLPLNLSPPHFQHFQYTFLHPLPSHRMVYDITIALLFFSFPSFLEFHRVVPLLQTCSTTEFVYDWFCMYVYLFIFTFTHVYTMFGPPPLPSCTTFFKIHWTIPNKI
jgi:hypothetical protein